MKNRKQDEEKEEQNKDENKLKKDNFIKKIIKSDAFETFVEVSCNIVEKIIEK